MLIIGILAAVALPQYQMSVQKSKIGTLLPLMSAVVGAQQRFLMENQSYAMDFNLLDVELPAGGTINDTGALMTYDSFFCGLYTSSVQCKMGSATIERYYNSTGFGCAASLANTAGNKICRAVSGKAQPGYTDASKNIYYF